jgi:putative DNA primase/helicase
VNDIPTSDHSTVAVETTAYAALAAVRLAAYLALDAGLSVLPPREDGTKAPLAEGGTWKDSQEQLPSRDRVIGWYKAPGRHGLGCVCGRVSGGQEGYSLCVLDVDDATIGRALVERAQKSGLAEQLDRAAAGYSEISPKGGAHVFVQVPGEHKSVKLAERPDPADPKKRVTLIETKCEGGYIVMAPSCGPVHPSGRPYVVRAGDITTIATISVGEWEALCDLARSLDEMPRQAVQEAPRKAGDRERPGDAWARATPWEAIIEPKGYTFVYQSGEEWMIRQLDKDLGISGTINYRGSDLLKMFSTSTPFDPAKTYTKFAAYAVLYHSGNFHAAARALAQHTGIEGRSLPPAAIPLVRGTGAGRTKTTASRHSPSGIFPGSPRLI